MKPARLALTHNLVVAYGLHKHMTMVEPRQATPEEMQAFHAGTLGYLYGFPTVDMMQAMHKETHRIAPDQQVLAPVGREMGLTDEDDINDFFPKYYYEKRVLEPNPGCEVMSADWIENSYGLRTEWRRQKRLIELGI